MYWMENVKLSRKTTGAQYRKMEVGEEERGRSSFWRHLDVKPTKIRLKRAASPFLFPLDFYLPDHLASIRGLENTSGTLDDSETFDAWGNKTSESNPSNGDRYAYTGRESDSAIGLQYNRARYYDPTTGRWISQDPTGFDAGDGNLYRYVSNTPVDFSDASGLQAVQNPWRNGGFRSIMSKEQIQTKFGNGTYSKMKSPMGGQWYSFWTYQVDRTVTEYTYKYQIQWKVNPVFWNLMVGQANQLSAQATQLQAQGQKMVQQRNAMLIKGNPLPPWANIPGVPGKVLSITTAAWAAILNAIAQGAITRGNALIRQGNLLAQQAANIIAQLQAGNVPAGAKQTQGVVTNDPPTTSQSTVRTTIKLATAVKLGTVTNETIYPYGQLSPIDLPP
jgi:RHS repeat-associated protein